MSRKLARIWNFIHFMTFYLRGTNTHLVTTLDRYGQLEAWVCNAWRVIPPPSRPLTSMEGSADYSDDSRRVIPPPSRRSQGRHQLIAGMTAAMLHSRDLYSVLLLGFETRAKYQESLITN